MTPLQTFAASHPFLLVTSVVLLSLFVIVLIIWALKEGREISFWPPRIGARPTSQSSASGARESRESRQDASTLSKTSEWQTEWRFSSGTHRESLTLEETENGAVTGTRVTQSHKGSKIYSVVGYAKGGWYWLEYHDSTSLGGGTMQLHAFTSGRLRGVVTYPDCKTGHHLCVANQWLLRGSEEQYDDAWRQKLAEVY